jgi:hypothetical protein
MTDINGKNKDLKENINIMSFKTNNSIKKLYILKLCSNKNFRFNHCIFVLLSGLVYIFAGFCYLPPYQEILEGEYLGGYMLALGSILLLTASYLDYNLCKKESETNNTKKSEFLETDIGKNYAMNMIGSFVFIFGGICFIPQTGMTDVAYYLIDFGNLIVFLSQSWKVLRIVNTTDEDDYAEIEFENKVQLISKINKSDIESSMKKYKSTFRLQSLNVFCFAEIFHGLNGLFYLIATYYMPTISEENLVYLTYMYISAGAVLIISAFTLIYKYFLYNEYENSNLDCNQDNCYKLIQ